MGVVASAAPSRRDILGTSAGVLLSSFAAEAQAIQGLTPGRVPGAFV